MPPRYISESKFFNNNFIINIILIIIIYINININYCTCQILSLQPDFLSQKLAIKKIIMGIKRAYKKYQVIYYPKFYYKLNHIKYFWYGNYKYSIKRLREDIFKGLAQIKRSIILEHYKSCLKKMDLYSKKIQYGTDE